MSILPCLICTNELGSAPTIVNSCGHEFHRACLARARAYHLTSCRMCNTPIDALLSQATVPVMPSEDAVVAAEPASASFTMSVITEAVDKTFVGSFHGIVDINFGSVSATTPVDLVVQCDASSSMTGAKATMMKNSLLALLDEMTENDRLALVRFASKAEPMQGFKRMTAENKENTRTIINSMVISGNTNIGDAVKWTEHMLDKRVSKNPSTGVILMSDGQDSHNYRFTDATTLCAKVPIYSLGIGEDHDHGLLSKAAEFSGATFQYAANPEAIPGAIGATVGALNTCVGHDGVLRIGEREYTYRTVYADMAKTELFVVPEGFPEVEVSFTYTDLSGQTVNQSHRIVLPDQAPAPQTHDNLLRIVSARNAKSTTEAMRRASIQSDEEAKATLEEAKAAIRASLAADTPRAAELLGDLDKAIASLNDRAHLTFLHSRLATQTGGLLGNTPSMHAASLRMEATATQVL